MNNADTSQGLALVLWIVLGIAVLLFILWRAMVQRARRLEREHEQFRCTPNFAQALGRVHRDPARTVPSTPTSARRDDAPSSDGFVSGIVIGSLLHSPVSERERDARAMGMHDVEKADDSPSSDSSDSYSSDSGGDSGGDGGSGGGD